MAFEGLTDKLQNAFRKLSSKGKLTEPDITVRLPRALESTSAEELFGAKPPNIVS